MTRLRFNGYFTVPNFIVHAGDDPARISADVVGNKTEVDTIAIRFPYSREESGIRFPVDANLVNGTDTRLDIVFAEVKSGRANGPNKIWRNSHVSHIEYLLKFVGCHKDDASVCEVARAETRKYCGGPPH